MELLAKVVDNFQPLTIFAKNSILDGRLGSENVSAIPFEISMYILFQDWPILFYFNVP